VAQGPESATAQRRFWPKKQFSQLAFADVRPFAIPVLHLVPSWKLDCGKAGIKADSTPLHNGEFRKAQEFSHRHNSL